MTASPLDHITVEVITTQQQMDAALAVRFRVFVEEQHVPIEEEVDHYDADPGHNPTVVHVLARDRSRTPDGNADGTDTPEGAPIATARLLLDGHDTYPHIGLVAVLAEYRRTGVGRLVMDALHTEARRRGIPGITLSAQLHAIPFYERLGYIPRGTNYLDAGIEHRDMDLVF